MMRRGRTRMVGPACPGSVSAGSVSASASPRISRHRTRHGSTEAMSSTTNAARPFSATLRNLRLPAYFTPADVDRPGDAVVPKPDRTDLKRAVRLHRRQAPQPLGGQVGQFGAGK